MSLYPTVPTENGTPLADAAPNGESVTISVTQDGAGFDITVPEGAGTIEIGGVSYAFDTADILGQAPLILGAPTTAAPVPEDLSLLTGVDYVVAPYLYDPAGGVPSVTLTTLRGDETLGTGAGYALTEFDRISGFSVRQDVTNSRGVGGAVAAIVAPLPYEPTRLTFGATHALVKADGVQPGGASTILAVVNAVLDERGGTFFRDASGTRLRAYFSSQSGRVFTSNMDGKLLLNFSEWYAPTEPFEAGDRICLMIQARPDFARYISYRNGALLKTWSRSYSGSTAKIDTTEPLTIGFTDFGSWKDYAIRGGVEDLRIWTDVAEDIDITTNSFAALFMDDTGGAKHPDIANTVFGQPKIWLPTDPAQANALVNLGTAGNFTSKLGVFA
ncbi:hypothetical protein [Paenirhodobacter populi]|uniref:Uncharacterized protein n=1 Tax=Paenirhodobacter populi TaxID=2306993 RepID=A0A443IPV0_9RHOB|nr:hypothetical protein [Sinirhodobacter populi]RWR08150.1 hypothetical protein D2T33_16120 [Sinirhodobacter populi]